MICVTAVHYGVFWARGAGCDRRALHIDKEGASIRLAEAWQRQAVTKGDVESPGSRWNNANHVYRNTITEFPCCLEPCREPQAFDLLGAMASF